MLSLSAKIFLSHSFFLMKVSSGGIWVSCSLSCKIKKLLGSWSRFSRFSKSCFPQEETKYTKTQSHDWGLLYFHLPPILLALFPFSRMVSILFHLDSIISSVSSVWDSDQERNSNWSVLKIHRHQKALTPQNSLRTSDPENSQTYLHFSCCSQPFLPHFAGTFC